MVFVRGSSNGRTTGSGPVYWGSSPYPRARFIKNTPPFNKLAPENIQAFLTDKG